MMFSDAIQSGKPIRRPIAKHMGSSGTGYLDIEYVMNLLTCGQIREEVIRPIIIDRNDLLANDWEVKE